MKPVKIRDLKISGSHVSSASGLVRYGTDFYTIADDDLSLFSFSIKEDQPGKLFPIFPGTLPKNHKNRKKVKPDWEALTFFNEGLLIIPSGSTETRNRGAHVSFDGNQPTNIIEVNFSQLYQTLQQSLPDLNLEGAVVMGSTLKLFQRGNGSTGQNAIINLDSAGIWNDIKNSKPLNSDRIMKIHQIDLGKLNGAALGFTDACADQQDLYFLAVAENTLNTYDDGQFLGAVMGKLSDQNEIIFLKEIQIDFKPEGLWVENGIFHLVTDADNPQLPSGLYMGNLV